LPTYNAHILFIFYLFWGWKHAKCTWYVTKKRGSEITQYTDCLHDPKRPCFPDLLHLNQTSVLPKTLTTYWLFQKHITRSEMYKCFASTQQQGRFHIIHPLPRPFTQMSAKETLSSQTIYIARKHKPDFHQTFTKPDSSAV